MPRTVLLATPPLPRLVPEHVFDAFGWNTSSQLEWRAPDGRDVEHNALDADLALRFAFVLRAPWDAVPTELARLHAGRGYDLGDELALAPYGIDDATDQLHAARRDAHATFWLAADNLNALFWALHDWVHFHNHGAFDDTTATELQCDASALAWLWLNRARVPLDETTWLSLLAQVRVIHRARVQRHPPRVALDESVFVDPDRLRTIVAAVAPT